jgi:hypothetical protein
MLDLTKNRYSSQWRAENADGDLQKYLDMWEKSGRVYFDRPRNKTISFSGKKPLSYADALKYLKDFFKDNK